MKRKTNISQYLPEVAEKFPDVTAVTFRESSVTFSELNRISDIYACELRKNGVKKGDRMLMMLKPGIEFIAAAFAAFKTGAVPVLIDPGMGIKNLLNCIEKTEPSVMVGIGKAHWVRLFFPSAFRSVKIFLSFGDFSPVWLKKMPDAATAAAESGGEEFEIEKTEIDDTAAIVFTTGSTGPPKGVVYTHRIYIAQTEMIRDFYGAGAEHRDMPAFPLFALFSAALGMPCVIPDINPSLPAQADPELIVNTIKKHNISFSFASPALWSRVCAYCTENKITLPEMQKVLMAGAPVSPSLHSSLASIISPDGDTFVPYGATEALPAANMCGSELDDRIRKKIMDGEGYCLGRPLPGITVRIIKPVDSPVEKWDESLVLPTGETGEIVVEGEIVTPEYHNLPHYTDNAKIRKDDNTVMHRMGDVGYFDDKGYLWFRGRKAHRVITETAIMYPVCCETVFNTHPLVFRSALVGIGEIGKQIPVVVIQPVPGVLPLNDKERTRVIDELKKLADSKKHTTGIKNFLFIDDFPVDIRHNAKIFREKLAVWAEKFASILT